MRLTLSSTSGRRDGYRHDLPLERDIASPIVVDATHLGPCHPMFVLRLRLFVDWHLMAGHEVTIRPPASAQAARQLSALRFWDDLPSRVVAGGGDVVAPEEDPSILGIRRIHDARDVEDIAQSAVDVLHQQIGPIAGWGAALHMAISELCDNALQHGASELGAYVAADRVLDPRREFRLVVADLGIGIPEHIRARHPEWQDDSAAISRVLQYGVSGTGDPQRGNGLPETIEYALEQQLIQTGSAVEMDIRAASGRIGVDVVQGEVRVRDGLATTPRRGTWISYTVVTA